jgi:arabinose-5-phosphate isomerase
LKDAAVSDAIALAREVIRTEADAVRALADRLDDSFDRAVQLLLGCRGRAVVTGVGKSGAIARKLAGILSSTGTPALFLHPAEGVHGDLGVVTESDVVIVLSYSGQSDEVVNIMPVVKRIGAKSIALTRAGESPLTRLCDVVLDVSVEKEAGPLGLAPTSSTTAMLAMGDALALAVMQERKFTREDFAQFHPAGALGRRLILRVRDLMRSGDEMAICGLTDTLRDVLFSITRAHAGAACVIAPDGSYAGVITDGDVRRHLLADESLSAPACDVMTRGGTTIGSDALAVEGLRLMEERKIGDLPVLEEGRPVGVLMLKDVTQAGLV